MVECAQSMPPHLVVKLCIWIFLCCLFKGSARMGFASSGLTDDACAPAHSQAQYGNDAERWQGRDLLLIATGVPALGMDVAGANLLFHGESSRTLNYWVELYNASNHCPGLGSSCLGSGSDSACVCVCVCVLIARLRQARSRTPLALRPVAVLRPQRMQIVRFQVAKAADGP